MTPQHHLPADIERTSMGIITAELAERGLAPVIICESAGTQAEDAQTMQRMYCG